MLFTSGAHPRGPWTIAQFTRSKQKEWRPYYVARLETFKTQRAGVAAGVASTIVASTVSEMKHAKKKASMETCKIAAATALDEINEEKDCQGKAKTKGCSSWS